MAGGTDRFRRLVVPGGVALFGVALIGLLLAMEVHLQTTTAELGAVQRSIGVTSGAGRPGDQSILGQMRQIGPLHAEVAAMSDQVGQLASELHTLSASGSPMASLPGLSTQIASLDHQISTLGGQLSGVASAVTPLSSIERSLASLQTTVATLERALTPASSSSG